MGLESVTDAANDEFAPLVSVFKSAMETAIEPSGASMTDGAIGVTSDRRRPATPSGATTDDVDTRASILMSHASGLASFDPERALGLLEAPTMVTPEALLTSDRVAEA